MLLSNTRVWRIREIEVQKDETTPKLRGLDELSLKDYVWEALKVKLDADFDVLAVKTIRMAYRGTQTVVVRLSMDIARQALEERECESDGSTAR